MVNRITEKHLQSLCDQINEFQGTPMKPYATKPSGVGFISQPGCYHIESAYGGHQLAQIYNTAGATTSPINCGFVSRRELHGLMLAFLEGLRARKSQSSYAEDLGRVDSERATQYGAVFRESGDDWIARAPSGVAFKASTKEEAAVLFCEYFNL